MQMKKVLLRVPEAVHDELKAAAYRNRRSVNSEILFRISEAVRVGDPDLGVRLTSGPWEPDVVLPSYAVPVPRPSADRSSFKPDFGSRLKEK
jgi:hypothetical protein